MANIYVTRLIPVAGIDILKDAGHDVEINPIDRTLTREEFLTKMKGRDAVLTMLTDALDQEACEVAKGCKVFGNYAVGYNNIDLDACTRAGIAATNTPGVLTDATADMAWALLFATARRIAEAEPFMRGGKYKAWGPMLFLGGDITGRTLGIIGAGRIGSNFAMKSKGFNMKVLYTDVVKNEQLEKELSAKQVDLDTLLKESDFVSLHVALTPETTHLIGKSELEKMKPTAYLINTSRGPVIDEAALVEALKNDSIAGAGLDVFEDEPAMKPGLTECENCCIVPHIASATLETRTKMATMVAGNILARLKGDRPPNILNPEVLEK
jgi:glyoxylate reductase